METFGQSRPAAAAALAALLLTACATTGPLPYAWTAPAPGTTWKMAQRNTGSYGQDAQVVVTRAADTSWKGAPAMTLAQSTGTRLLATPQAGRLHAVLAPDGRPLISWEPPVGFDYPLQVGKTFKTHHRMTSHARGGLLTEMDFSCAVSAFEKVTVPAGTFDTYKLDCTAAGTSETYWIAPSVGLGVKTIFVRPAGSPFGAGTQQSELVEFRR